MGISRVLLLVGASCISLPLHAGRIEDLFHQGVFGTTWTDTFEAVKSKFPNGRSLKAADDDEHVRYEIIDGRRILEIDRRKNDRIDFQFDRHGILQSVSVQFPECMPLVDRLFEYFGAPTEVTPTGTGVVMLGGWSDASIGMSVILDMPTCNLLISHYDGPAPASRAQLGIE